MSTKIVQWRSSITIPFDEGVHNVVHAFLRTSEWGEWIADETAQSDPFVLKYRRGLWRRSLLGSLGLGPRLVHRDWISQGKRAAPMRLTVTLRPSPRDVQIIVRHYFDAGCAPFFTKAASYFSEWVHTEVNGLAYYLAKVYSLPALTAEFREGTEPGPA